MKKMILAAAMAVSATSAFANICEVDMVDNRTNRRITTMRAYDFNDGCKEGMKECRKEIRLRGLLGRADCVRADDRYPYPGPQNPGPQNPGPGYPGPQYGVNATALIENMLFEVSGRDASELYMNCLTDIRRLNLRNVDELFVTANGNRFRSLSTTSWYNETSICSILEQEARTIQSSYSINARIVGSLENFPFRFEGMNRSNLLKNCVASIASLRLGSTDELQYSVNGMPFTRMTTNGWWQNPESVCKVLLINMDSRL